ncbi:hypothetical protein Y032_0046g1375 [Ancylostoma ceylanicum]|uniref:Uncharacterized protein n=1 Tax=Ancylostoma ceylanicum TaxID=53326 RepID=A0A016UBK8_9BILA|nr:hypothetical protein Y032_0046g1375 [Ancylostoma ceylanicum]
MTPLISVLKHHWKIALAGIGATLALSAATYLMGPLVLIYLAKLIIRILSSIIGSLLSCFGRPCKTVGTAREQEEA